MSIAVPSRGADILEWARKITRAVNRHRPIAGPGMRQSTTEDGTVFSSVPDGGGKLPVYIDLASVLTGPYAVTATLGKWVVIDKSSATVTQQPVGTTRPSPVPQNQVWLDITITSGCHFF